ncbi:MAG: potassium channel family protein [Mycobacteriales bacterium]
MPHAVSMSQIQLPAHKSGPLRAVVRRMLLAFAVLVTTVIVVYLDRAGYRDTNDGSLTLLDALYYATVTLSTTGYGDIVPASESARLVNVLVITPLRVLFLIILVGTTLEVLTERTRQQLRLAKWRHAVGDHTVIVGYGTKGRSAVRALLAEGTELSQIVVIDPDLGQVNNANAAGVTAIHGDGTSREVLELAEIATAARILVAAHRDDTAVLVTLTVRQLNTAAPIIVAVRESENVPLLTQSGATSVVVSSEAAGRLLGLAAVSPAAGAVFEDLLIPHTDLELIERELEQGEAGNPTSATKDLVVAVLRGGHMHRFGTKEAEILQHGDRVVAVRHSGIIGEEQREEPA